MQDNIYGIQRVRETNVRTEGDILEGTAGAAAQGAKAGSAFGPWGTAIGGAAGLVVGAHAGIAGQRLEERQLAQDESRNDFVDNLEGRGHRTQQVVGKQARNGMKANRYVMAEIEGDGGRYEEGIGEIHVDKNFNIKRIAAGEPTHEEGGVKVAMEEGDSVFNTQTSKKKFSKIRSLLNRYKNGDERALKALKKERDKLPTDEDYENVESETRSYEGGVGSVVTDIRQKAGDKELGEGDWNKLLDEGLEGSGYTKRDVYDHMKEQGMDVGSSYSDNFFGPMSTESANKTWGYKEPEFDAYNPDDYTTQDGITSPSSVVEDEPGFQMPSSNREAVASEDPSISPSDELSTSGKTTTSNPLENIKFNESFGNSNPLKYASAAHNIYKGMQPAETVERRNIQSDRYKYEDHSERARAENVENRNFQTRTLQGRVGRSGSLGTSAQTSSQYLKQSEAINANENRQRYAIDQANTNLANQDKQTNLQLNVQADDKDAQNRAAKEAFTGTGLAEVSELAQLGEQRNYMKSRDAKADARDQQVIDNGYISSTRYNIGDDGKVQYKKHKKGVKSKQINSGSYTMLPDGTIIVD